MRHSHSDILPDLNILPICFTHARVRATTNGFWNKLHLNVMISMAGLKYKPLHKQTRSLGDVFGGLVAKNTSKMVKGLWEFHMRTM